MRVLYCHCANTRLAADDDRRRVRAALRASGADVEATADLCGLAARRDARLAALAAAADLHVVACYPRAVRWLFEAAGAPLRPDAQVHNLRAAGAAGVLEALGLGGAPADRETADPPEPPDALAPAGPGEWVPWFPVIDYDRCRACRQCAEFCLFGVYRVAPEGRVEVVRPEKCKTNCPACARNCPHSAIVFAKFADGGPIAGDEGLLAEPAEPGMKRDLAGLAEADIYEVLRRRGARATGADRRTPRESPGR